MGWRSKNLVSKSKFRKNFQPRHQKVRRTPISFRDKLNTEHRKLPDQKHFSPIVVRVTKNQSLKLALESIILNKVINKSKYQMQKIDTLIKSIHNKSVNTRRKAQHKFQH